MRIRHKLLILLLGIAIVPLVLMSWYGQATTRSLGRDVAERARSSLTSLASDRLRRLADAYGAILRGKREVLDLSIRLQARGVERLLEAAPEDLSEPVWFVGDFDRGDRLPPDAGPASPRHLRIREDRRLEPVALSFARAAFWLPPGVSREDVDPDITRLARVDRVFRGVLAGRDDLFHWQYVSLANGLHVTYPGHGGYPESFDPRKRDWYLRAMAEGRRTEIPPSVDASTGQVTLSTSMPVRAPDGSILGVTGIDIRLVDVLDQVSLPPDLSDGGRALIVARRPREDGSGKDLFAIAQYDYLASRPAWDVPVQIERIHRDSGEYRRMIEDLDARRSGVVSLPYRNSECLWAYGPVDDKELDVLIVVPDDLVIADARELEGQVLEQTRSHLLATGVIFLGVLALVVYLASRVSRSVTRPIRRLSATARMIASGELHNRVDVGTGDELQDLAEAFNALGPYLEDRLQMREALQLAMEVQQHLLPKGAPRLSGYDISGTSIYCDETGGDYFDYFDYLAVPRSGRGSLGIAVGDVSGHGVAAALLMATARALLRAHAAEREGTAALLGEVNEHLCADISAGRFMTLFLLELDGAARRIRWCSAGHEPAILYDPATGEFEHLGGRDIALGIDEGWKFTEHTREPLREGQVLFLGTDGIPETRNPAGDQFGHERLREIIRKNAGRAAAAIQREVTDALRWFRQNRPQEDDITLVVVRVLPAAAEKPE